MREFRSRVRAALRRAEMSPDPDIDEEPLERGDLRIDFAKRTTDVRGEPVRLTYVEFEILAVLMRHPGRVYTREMLLDRVWGDSAFRDQRTVDVHIRHLREKVERDPEEPRAPADGARRRLPLQRRMIWHRIWRTSIKNRLTFLFFAITAGAIMVIYFYVVPQLESNLISQKVDALRRDSLPTAARSRERSAVRCTASQLDALHPRDQRGDRHAGDAARHPGRRQSQPAAVGRLAALRDLRLAGRQDPGSTRRRPRAARARARARSRPASKAADGRRPRPGGAADLLPGRPSWVVVFSEPLDDVRDNVGADPAPDPDRRRDRAARRDGQRLLRRQRASRAASSASSARPARSRPATSPSPIPVDSEDELGQLAQAFNEMQRKLARLDTARQEFIANASHELRTPIFSLGGFVELLAGRGPRRGDAGRSS